MLNGRRCCRRHTTSNSKKFLKQKIKKTWALIRHLSFAAVLGRLRGQGAKLWKKMGESYSATVVNKYSHKKKEDDTTQSVQIKIFQSNIY